MKKVLETFSIFCDFFGIRKYFLDSTYLKILKIEFHESGSGRKISKKLFLNSPHERVPTNKFLDFHKLCLCFHRTFMKNVEKHLKGHIHIFDVKLRATSLYLFRSRVPYLGTGTLTAGYSSYSRSKFSRLLYPDLEPVSVVGSTWYS